MNLFGVNSIMVTIGGYPLSYIEFLGTVLYFLSVILISRKNILTWPVGIISVLLYFILFYQIQLYADMIEQIYYLVISIIGWAVWRKKKEEHPEKTIQTSWSSMKGIIAAVIVTAVLTYTVSFCTSNFHKWFPGLFAEEASFPFLDALTTVMSFMAMYLTTIRKNEGWIYWITVDIAAIWLYWVKGVRFISIQYIILLGIAVYGFLNWIKNSPSGKTAHGGQRAV